MRNFKKTLDQYIDARMPIIFVDTLEDDIAEDEIFTVLKRKHRGILSWSPQSFRDYTDNTNIPKKSLNDILNLLLADEDDLVNKVLILKNINNFLDNTEVNNYIKIFCSKNK